MKKLVTLDCSFCKVFTAVTLNYLQGNTRLALKLFDFKLQTWPVQLNLKSMVLTCLHLASTSTATCCCSQGWQFVLYMERGRIEHSQWHVCRHTSVWTKSNNGGGRGVGWGNWCSVSPESVEMRPCPPCNSLTATHGCLDCLYLQEPLSV